jgi:FKBP-type peptidyl-prolyl cis-trans isomerases 1
MRFAHLFALLYPFTPFVAAVDSLKVTVYEGPLDCADSEKVKNGDYLNMHYTGTIDESSETGEKGSKFDSSRDRGQTFDFQIGQGRVIKGCEFQNILSYRI